MSFFNNRRNAEIPPPPTPTGERKPTIAVSAQQPVGFETVLGANSVLEGHLRSSANVRLDGTLTGTLEISGNVLIGETARINADVNARNISIAGAVRGNVSGKKVQILRTGRVWGDIHAEALTTEEGAFIDGKIAMTRPDITGEAATAPTAEDTPKPIPDAAAAPPNPDDKADPTPAGGAEEAHPDASDPAPTSADIDSAASDADAQRAAADAAGINEADPYTPG